MGKKGKKNRFGSSGDPWWPVHAKGVGAISSLLPGTFSFSYFKRGRIVGLCAGWENFFSFSFFVKDALARHTHFYFILFVEDGAAEGLSGERKERTKERTKERRRGVIYFYNASRYLFQEYIRRAQHSSFPFYFDRSLLDPIFSFFSFFRFYFECYSNDFLKNFWRREIWKNKNFDFARNKVTYRCSVDVYREERKKRVESLSSGRQMHITRS